MARIALAPAAELSYLSKGEQNTVLSTKLLVSRNGTNVEETIDIERRVNLLYNRYYVI